MRQRVVRRDGTVEIRWDGQLARNGCRGVGVPSGADLGGRDVGLNLRGVSFVRPFGLVFLFWYIRDLVDNHGVAEVIIAEPADPDVATYLRRMRLPAVFQGDDRVRMPELEDRSIHRRDLSGQLVELETFRVDHDNEVNRQTSRLMEVVLAQSDLASGRKEELGMTFSEVLSNIQVHSETREAALAVQSYRNGLRLAFGDGGVGIPTRMEGHEDLPDDASDAEVIRTAMEPLVTSRPEMGGMGLTHLREIAVESGGLAIRSGQGEVEVRQRLGEPEENLHDAPHPVAGTLVGVRLSPA